MKLAACLEFNFLASCRLLAYDLAFHLVTDFLWQEIELRFVLACLSGAMFSAGAVAQIPDAASVIVPNLQSVSDPRIQKEGWKHFFFHKDGVSYTQAYEDFADCYRFLGGPAPVGPQPLPPYGARARLPSDERLHSNPPSNGLVGMAIGEMVMGPMQRRLPQSRLRRCMEPRGYVRYPIDEPTWKLLVDAYSIKSIAVQAKVASGPRPVATVVSQ